MVKLFQTNRVAGYLWNTVYRKRSISSQHCVRGIEGAAVVKMATATTPRANGHANAIHRELFEPPQYQFQASPIPVQYLPDGSRSLPGISIRAFCLGIAFGCCSLSAGTLAYLDYGLWRLPFFVATLATFHYLEFDMTARFNPPDGKVTSFLLFNNGSAYTIAHTTAMFETIVRHWLRSSYKPDWLRIPFSFTFPTVFPTVPSQVFALLGIFLVVLGQSMRSLAMAHAKTNFNHIVQSTKKTDHVLVTTGVYAFSRHPSYFGFFWWGLGTQLVLGNHFCFLAYTFLLWNFFNRRIRAEEKHLIEFFGQDYLTYRERVNVRIPFIQ